MRALTKIAVAAVLLGPVSVIVAQNAPATSPTEKPPEPAGKQWTRAEIVDGAGQIDSQLEDDSRTIVHLRDTARRLKDNIKLGCVNDRAMQANAQRNIADGQKRDALAQLDSNLDSARASYEGLRATASSVAHLRDEAKSCVGTPELVKNESGVEVQHGDIPDDPTTDNPFDDNANPPAEAEEPGYASPYF